MTVFSILTGSDVTKVKSEVTIVFSGKFYISYQVFIAVTTLEVTVYSVFVLFFSENCAAVTKRAMAHFVSAAQFCIFLHLFQTPR